MLQGQFPSHAFFLSLQRSHAFLMLNSFLRRLLAFETRSPLESSETPWPRRPSASCSSTGAADEMLVSARVDKALSAEENGGVFAVALEAETRLGPMVEEVDA